ncbi:MAG TPA: hypothetical protein VN962_00095 [Polyangia bacterium]|nr:hypothetical protein [Polyangia bacterium]
MHTHRRLSTFLLASATVVMSSASAFAQVDAPPAETAPIDVPPPPPPPPPPVEVAPPPPVPPAAVPMATSVAASTAIAPSQSPFKIETPNGSSIKLGLLLQPQFQMSSSTALDGHAYNLYLRRTRILLGGTLFGAIEYFVETDSPNLMLASSTGAKGTPGVAIQDAFATAKPFGDVFKVDVGYMLPPLAHNAVQGAGTLLGWDYFANSFLTSAAPFFGAAASTVGRDTGVQLRGLVLDGHLEYRAGLFQGIRNPPAEDANMMATSVPARNFFRFAARVQVNLLDPETGFFYAGTYLGAKRILSIGGSVDIQDSYRYFAGDVFADLPAGPGVFTGQVNVAYWNGTYVTTPPKATAIMAEVGYNVAGLRISPILRFEDRLISSTAVNPSTHVETFGGGVGWWPYGHASNLKLFFMQTRETNEAHAANQVNLQWQVYFF